VSEQYKNKFVIDTLVKICPDIQEARTHISVKTTPLSNSWFGWQTNLIVFTTWN